MLKIKELLKDFIETQKQINESIKALKETKDFENNKLSSTICTVNRLDTAIRTVATYSQGQRYVARLSGKEFDDAVNVADKLYRLILGLEVKE